MGSYLNIGDNEINSKKDSSAAIDLIKKFALNNDGDARAALSDTAFVVSTEELASIIYDLSLTINKLRADVCSRVEGSEDKLFTYTSLNITFSRALFEAISYEEEYIVCKWV